MSEINKFGVADIDIPPEVLFNPELSTTEMNLFGILRLLSQSKKGCCASNLYLSQIMMCAPQTISNSISKLKNQHYINIIYSKTLSGLIRGIYINPDFQKIYRSLVEEVHCFLEKIQEDGEIPAQGELKSILYNHIKGNQKNER